MRYTQHFSTRKTPQSEPIPGREDMVKNSAGGYVFAVDDWKRLQRFLILGSDGGTYYVKERKLTIANAQCVARCLKADGPRVVREIVAISDAGRAPSNDPALFALAMAMSPKFADSRTRWDAFGVADKVARIGTHWFHLAREVNELRGWGRGLRTVFSNYYLNTDIDRLAFQCVKYQQRDGWSHRDLLRLSHPAPEDLQRDALFKWVCTGEIKGALPPIVTGYILAQKAKTHDEIIGLINTYGLTREMIPTRWLSSVAVWNALLPKMPVMATVRNLGKMTSIGLLKPLNHATHMVVRKLEKRVAGSRIHPLQVLVGLKTYQEGKGFRGSLSWEPVGAIVDALDDAFYDSFGNVEPTGKRTMLALDVSASMTWHNVAGMPITPRVASSAMAMVIARAEPYYMVTAFTCGSGMSYERGNWGVQALDISHRERLDDIMGRVNKLRAGGTDCSLPMVYATKNGLEIDTFVILTDNETWAGRIHPSQALQEYRAKSGIPAKLVTIGMTSTGFSIADPNDLGMLDVVGFDTATPNVISEFAR